MLARATTAHNNDDRQQRSSWQSKQAQRVCTGRKVSITASFIHSHTTERGAKQTEPTLYTTIRSATRRRRHREERAHWTTTRHRISSARTRTPALALVPLLSPSHSLRPLSLSRTRVPLVLSFIFVFVLQSLGLSVVLRCRSLLTLVVVATAICCCCLRFTGDDERRRESAGRRLTLRASLVLPPFAPSPSLTCRCLACAGLVCGTSRLAVLRAAAASPSCGRASP